MASPEAKAVSRAPHSKPRSAAHRKWLRKEIQDALIGTQSAIIAAMDRREQGDRKVARRFAVEQWLVKNGHIRAFESPEVSPHFAPKQSHS
jgi:endonuclease YncB( thermonuclease family)